MVEHVRHQLDDRLFLLRLAHRRHERDCCQRIRGDDFFAAVALQRVIHAEVVGEQSGGAAFVPVGERVVFHHEVEQVCRALLNARAQVLTGEGLLHRAENAAERVVALNAEHHVFRELSANFVDDGACVLVVKLDRGLGAVWCRESAVVVLVEKLEGW